MAAFISLYCIEALLTSWAASISGQEASRAGNAFLFASSKFGGKDRFVRLFAGVEEEG